MKFLRLAIVVLVLSCDAFIINGVIQGGSAADANGTSGSLTSYEVAGLALAFALTVLGAIFLHQLRKHKVTE